MKYILSNWKLFILVAMVSPLLAGCVKKKDESYTDFSKQDEFVIIPNSGLANFWGDAYLYVDPYSPDTVTVNVIVGLASTGHAAKDINVTISIDDPKRVQFNMDNTWAAYEGFTSDMYTLKETNLTIKSGAQYAQTQLEIYTQHVDFNQSWMLPITITDASGKSLTSNMNTMYYHIY